MPRNESTRIYVRTAEDQFGRLFWVNNNQPNDMLLGAYGLNGQPATITYEFPERLHVAGEPGARRFLYDEASPVDLKLDHFACHPDGTFLAKARSSAPPFYSHFENVGAPLNRASPRFLEVLVVTDVLQRYVSIPGQPKNPNVCFQFDPACILELHMSFSGIDYDLEGEIGATVQPGQTALAARLRSGSLKGLILAIPHAISAEASAARPPGTLLDFCWPIGPGPWKHKTFILN